MQFLRTTLLWIVALPYVFTGLGAASNQLVLIANHDTFPVMVNPAQIDAMGGVKFTFGDTLMLDEVHCVMTDGTHLNFMADIFDLKSATYSIGDFLLMFGDWLGLFCPIICSFSQSGSSAACTAPVKKTSNIALNIPSNRQCATPIFGPPCIAWSRFSNPDASIILRKRTNINVTRASCC